MLISDPKQFMILKLTNPEDFQYTRSYWHDDFWYQFEGFIKDEQQLASYGGEPYGDDYYFMVHSVFYPGQEMDHNGGDAKLTDTHPWVVLITGDHTYLAVMLRFTTYAEFCEWCKEPKFDNLIYIY